MSKSLKILVCGDVKGKFDQLYKRVKALQDKGQQFDSLFVVGDFFSPFAEALAAWEEYASGKKEVPIVTYIIGPRSENLSRFYEGIRHGTELCPNVIFMGTRGMITLAGGLRVGYLSGMDCGSVQSARHTFSLPEVHNFLRPLVATEKTVDVLFTSDWPSGVTKYAGLNEKAKDIAGSVGVSQLAYFLKPRYHFSVSEDFFYERVPYRNHMILTERPLQATRFISLAKIGGKEKSLYAFSITPMMHATISEVTRQADNTTENPYPNYDLPQEEESAYKGFFYDQKDGGSGEPHNKKQRRGERREPRLQQISQDDCWFCLASEKVAKHLVASIGNLCYLTMAKGGVNPYHCMILPIGHHRNMSDLEIDCRIELAKYKTALNSFFASRGEYLVYFERNYKCSHMQLQAVPLSSNVGEDVVKAAFIDYGASVGVQIEEIPLNTDVSQAVDKNQAYFFAEFGKTKLLTRIRGNFPLNFGREVICCSDILNAPEKSDWRECSLSKEEETKITNKFKEEFKSFDFAQIDDDDSDEA